MEQIKVRIEEKTDDPNEKVKLTSENGGVTMLSETKETLSGSGKII